VGNESKQEPHITLVETEHPITPGNPFANLKELRNPQDYAEYLGGEAVTKLPVRTLKEGIHLRVNPDPNYSLLGVYTGRGVHLFGRVELFTVRRFSVLRRGRVSARTSRRTAHGIDDRDLSVSSLADGSHGAPSWCAGPS
jgi:hypothetical protein